MRVLVQDHHVRAQALEPPVLLRLQHLADEREVVLLDHAHEQDRAGRPRSRAATAPPAPARCGRAPRARRAASASAYSTREARRSKRMASSARDAQVPQAALRVQERQREAARAGAPGRGTCGRGPAPPRGSTPPRWRTTAARTRPAAAARAGAGWRWGPGRRRWLPESDRPSRACGFATVRPRPRNRARSVSHSTGPCARPSRLSTCTPQSGGSSCARGRRRNSSAALVGHVFGLHEQLDERGMGEVVGVGRQHHLRVARDLDLPRAVVAVRQGQPPDLDVVFGGDGDVELRGDAVVQAAEGRLLGQEDGLVLLGLAADGVVGGGPDGAAAHVAQVEELAARIAGRVLAVAGDHAAAAEAGAAAGVA